MDHGGKAVLPIHLFAFEILAWKVSYGQLHDAKMEARDLGGHFRFEPEAVGFQLDIFNYVCAEKFTAGFHVGQIQATHDVAERREKAIHQIMEGSVNLDP